MILRILSIVAGLIAQSFALSLVLCQGQHAFLAYSVAAIAAIPGMMVSLPDKLSATRTLPLLLCTVFAFAFPVLGLCFIGLIGWVMRGPASGSDEAIPYVLGTDPALARDSVSLSQCLQQSVVDLLHSTDRQARRNAILSLKGVDPRLAIPILRKGVQDSDEQVRIYAQNLLTDILERRDDCIKQAEVRLRSADDDPIAMIHLAEQLHEAVFLGLIPDEESRRSQLNNAILLLERAVTLASDNSHGLLLLMKCYIRNGDPLNAEKCYIRLQKMQIQEEILTPWMLEIFFLERQWDDLRTLFASFRSARFTNPKIETLAGFWLDTRSASA